MDYFKNPAISASGLKLLLRSPAHFKAARENPPEPTAAMQFGTACHCAVLEPAEFDNRYTVIPEGLDRKTKEGKEIYAAIVATGKIPLKYDDMQRILKMQASVQAHPVMRSLPSPIFEREFYFNFDGIAAKMKPDLIIEPCNEFPNGCIIDLKTCPDASPEGFARSMWNGSMHIQAAFYVDSFARIYSNTPEFLWLAAESKEPHLCAFYSLPEHILEYGRAEYERLLDIYNACVEAGEWPGYSQSINKLALPSWAENIIAGGGEVEIEFLNDEEQT